MSQWYLINNWLYCDRRCFYIFETPAAIIPTKDNVNSKKWFKQPEWRWEIHIKFQKSATIIIGYYDEEDGMLANFKCIRDLIINYYVAYDRGLIYHKPKESV